MADIIYPLGGICKFGAFLYLPLAVVRVRSEKATKDLIVKRLSSFGVAKKGSISRNTRTAFKNRTPARAPGFLLCDAVQMLRMLNGLLTQSGLRYAAALNAVKMRALGFFPVVEKREPIASLATPIAQ